MAQVTKLINRKKLIDFRSFNMAKIEETLKRGGSLRRTERKHGIGRDRMYSLRDETGNVTNNMDEIVRIAEKFYAQFYDRHASPDEITESIELINGEGAAINKEEVENALKKMSRKKAAGEDVITVGLLKDGGSILLEAHAKLYSRCLRTIKVPAAWKNANIILIHKKGDIKQLKNYRPI